MTSEHSESIVFSWQIEEFEQLLRTCDVDETTPYLVRYLPRDGLVVEAGCGLGRFVKYLADRGYDVEGVEYDVEASEFAAAQGIRVIQGDVLHLAYEDGSVAGVISLGVVEHFPKGPGAPLAEAVRVLRPGGVLVITVPSMNSIRRLKRSLHWPEARRLLSPRSLIGRNRLLRRLSGKAPSSPPQHNRGGSLPYSVYPAFGDFFEYRLTKSEFERVLRDAGLCVEESVPIAHIDGVYHEFGRALVGFEDWSFRPTRVGAALNGLLVRRPFLHNHMHLCVCRKPASE